jgi:hypothetical protein
VDHRQRQDCAANENKKPPRNDSLYRLNRIELPGGMFTSAFSLQLNDEVGKLLIVKSSERFQFDPKTSIVP